MPNGTGPARVHELSNATTCEWLARVTEITRGEPGSSPLVAFWLLRGGESNRLTHATHRWNGAKRILTLSFFSKARWSSPPFRGFQLRAQHTSAASAACRTAVTHARDAGHVASHAVSGVSTGGLPSQSRSYMLPSATVNGIGRGTQ
jgi:hypothetical protein